MTAHDTPESVLALAAMFAPDAPLGLLDSLSSLADWRSDTHAMLTRYAAHLAAPQDAVAVKPLKWTEDPNIPGRYTAHPFEGIWYRADEWWHLGRNEAVREWRSDRHNAPTEAADLSAAKAAAQADFAVRIRSALAALPPHPPAAQTSTEESRDAD